MFHSHTIWMYLDSIAKFLLQASNSPYQGCVKTQSLPYLCRWWPLLGSVRKCKQGKMPPNFWYRLFISFHSLFLQTDWSTKLLQNRGCGGLLQWKWEITVFFLIYLMWRMCTVGWSNFPSRWTNESLPTNQPCPLPIRAKGRKFEKRDQDDFQTLTLLNLLWSKSQKPTVRFVQGKKYLCSWWFFNGTFRL